MMNQLYPGINPAASTRYGILDEAQRLVNSIDYDTVFDRSAPPLPANPSGSSGRSKARSLPNSRSPVTLSSSGSLENWSHTGGGTVGKAKSRAVSIAPQQPQRPLSAYNIFFQLERENILNGTSKKVSADDVAAISGKRTTQSKSRRRREHHGKIGFFDLAREIGERWKKLDESERAVYMKGAALEKQRYQSQLARARQYEMEEGELTQEPEDDTLKDDMESLAANITSSIVPDSGAYVAQLSRQVGEKCRKMNMPPPACTSSMFLFQELSMQYSFGAHNNIKNNEFAYHEQEEEYNKNYNMKLPPPVFSASGTSGRQSLRALVAEGQAYMREYQQRLDEEQRQLDRERDIIASNLQRMGQRQQLNDQQVYYGQYGCAADTSFAPPLMPGMIGGHAGYYRRMEEHMYDEATQMAFSSSQPSPHDLAVAPYARASAASMGLCHSSSASFQHISQHYNDFGVNEEEPLPYDRDVDLTAVMFDPHQGLLSPVFGLDNPVDGCSNMFVTEGPVLAFEDDP